MVLIASGKRILGGRALSVTVVAAIAIALVAPGSALAYDGYAAAMWADAHALSYTCWDPSHPNALPCDTDDCTNFVSDALHYGGGYTEHVGDGNINNNANWWLAKNGMGLWVQSRTWLYTSGWPNLYSYQLAHIPGGWLFATYPGNTYTTYNGLGDGDVLFYDWGGGMIHAAIQTTAGEDPNWQNGHTTGDLIDEHSTTNRRRVWWTLSPDNSYRNSTTISLVKIGSGN